MKFFMIATARAVLLALAIMFVSVAAIEPGTQFLEMIVGAFALALFVVIPAGELP